MNVAMKAALAATAVGFALASTPSQAVIAPYAMAANAPAHCQAFTPGPSNTVRNRVIGSENVGAAMNVACAFETLLSETSSNVTGISMYFNNTSAASINVNCTLLTGYQGEEGAVVVNHSVAVASGVQSGIDFVPSDIDATATDLGNVLVGVNCNLPTGGVINDTYVSWEDENGVEQLN